MRKITDAAIIALICFGCAAPVGAHGSAPRELLPNLVELPPSDIAVGPGAAGTFDLRFTSTAGNNGDGPLAIAASRPTASAPFTVVQKISVDGGVARTRTVRVSLTFQPAPGHDHFHLARFERYELLDASGKLLFRDTKAGYCLGDRTALGTLAAPKHFTSNCGFGKPDLLRLTEGITTGWADPYAAQVAGQSFVLTGLPAGVYTLVNRVNDQRLYLESSYTDDVAAAKLRLAWPNGPESAPTVTVLDTCLAASC